MTRRSMQKFYFERIRNKITTILVTHSVDEALLIGNTIMIGVGPNSQTFEIDRDKSVGFEAWEESSAFATLRKQILASIAETTQP